MKKIALFALFSFLLALGIAGGYFFSVKYMKKPLPPKMEKTLPKPVVAQGATGTSHEALEADFTYLKIYYPVEGRLLLEQRRVPKAASKQALAGAAVSEFFKGPAGLDRQYLPANVRLLGIYFGEDGMLYLDLSEELSRGFRGGALEEFLLLRGLYDSLMSNVYGVMDIKLLLEGKEVETIGGHLSVLGPLGVMVTTESAEDTGEERP